MKQTTFKEEDLTFDFSKAQSIEKLDEQGVPLPKDMKFVDFVVEEKDRVLLVEVKDPLPSSLPKKHLKKVTSREISKIKTKEMINGSLVPKARSSYSYLHLMNRDNKPFDFIFLTGVDRLGVSKELLINFRDRLLARLRKEAATPWKNQYIRDCYVFTEKDWNLYFSHYPVTRSSKP